ncbi:MAG: N-acetylmuramoyl-L-alanine amidase [Saprospiraceae bacterium]|nr:N-acetylmuramoyl-L-alanine amidase [Saprospiraceae bacterium]MCB9323682.1 N-acetylmuramoyl-L-alanine amidase [Lewinellaceae bacterium]
MFKKIIDAIKLLFSSIFGGGKKTPTKIETEALTNAPQDAAEIKPDTIVMVSNEMESVIIPPDDKGPEFDADLFEEVTDPIVEIVPEPVPAVPDPEPEPEPDPVPVTDSEPTPATTHTPRYLWCLDNGHGSKTPGKRSPVFDDGETQFFEYEFNRNIVARIIKQLEVIGVKYFNVVPEVDTDNFLEGRVNRANNKKSDLPKIFLSVHSNAAPAASSTSWAADNISGIETWFFHNSKKGQKIASIFQKHLLEKTGFQNRHIKSKPDKQFYVLRKTKMVSVLTENGFYNNKKEAAKLITDEVRQKIADAHVAAILEIEENGI